MVYLKDVYTSQIEEKLIRKQTLLRCLYIITCSFSKNILIFFSFLYRSIELLYKKEVKFVEKKIKGLVLFFFVQDLLVMLCVWYGKNLQSLHIVQAFIIAVFLKQLFVLAAFYYTAFVEYINAVGIFDCR